MASGRRIDCAFGSRRGLAASRGPVGRLGGRPAAGDLDGGSRLAAAVRLTGRPDAGVAGAVRLARPGWPGGVLVGAVPARAVLEGVLPGGAARPRPSARPVPAQARSPTVMTSLETSATTSAEPRGITGASAAISASSRGPTPLGKITSTKPTDQASAYAPTESSRTPVPRPLTSATSSQSCRP